MDRRVGSRLPKNTLKKPALHTDEQRICAVRRAYSKEEKYVKSVVDSLKINKITFYQWRKNILGKDAQSTVDELRDDLPDDPEQLRQVVADLKAQAYELKLEIAIRKGTSDILKKDAAPTRTG